MRERLTYANVMVTVLAFIVLGGSAWALSKNTVGSKQLKPGAVHTGDIADGAVDSNKIAPGVIPDAAPNPTTTVRSTDGRVPIACTESNFGPNSYTLFCTGQKSFTASCANGEHATGGGYTPSPQPTTTPPQGTPSSSTSVGESRPEPATGTPTGWYIDATGFGSNSGSSAGLARPVDPPVSVYAVCSS